MCYPVCSFVFGGRYPPAAALLVRRLVVPVLNKLLQLPLHPLTHNLVLYLAHEHTRGLEGQPPVQYEHEVVTGDGDVDTLLQATP